MASDPHGEHRDEPVDEAGTWEERRKVYSVDTRQQVPLHAIPDLDPLDPILHSH